MEADDISDNKIPNKKYNKNPQYNCVKCNFMTINKKDYNRHLNTNKHKNIDIDDIHKTETIEIDNKNIYQCKCGKSYKHAPNLYRHKKTCSNNSFKFNKNEKNEFTDFLKKIEKNIDNGETKIKKINIDGKEVYFIL